MGQLGREVVGIRTDTIYEPVEHDHVIMVKLADDTELSQGEAVEVIRGGEFLHTKGLPLHIHRCPHCGSYPYLTAPPKSCEICGFVANSAEEEMAHMNAAHPEVIEQRMRDAGFRRGPDGEWIDGWGTDA